MAMDIIRAMEDENLFRPFFRDPETWASWRVVLRALFSLKLSRSQQKLFNHHTGRLAASADGFRELWCICGRRSGKSSIASLVAVYLALFYDYSEYLSPGEKGIIQIVASDRAQARVILRYCKGLLRLNPLFEQHIIADRTEAIELSNAINIEVATCSYRGIRGRTLVCCICDEIAFWRSDDFAANPDKEVLAALRPAMATIPTSKLLVLSSPYRKTGELYRMYKQYYGRDDSDILIWRAPTIAMNPSIENKLIERELERDPVAGRSEWEGYFRTDLEGFVSEEMIDAVTVAGRLELPYVKKFVYNAFTDPSGGRGDSFTLAVAHREGERRVLDLIREKRAPFDPSVVVEEFSSVLKNYGLHRVTGDKYAGSWVSEAFAKHGIFYEASSITKSDIYLALLPKMASRIVELLDKDRLKRQLLSLERRTTRSGKDYIDHPSMTGAHDDLANAAAGALVSSVATVNISEDDAFGVLESCRNGGFAEGPELGEELGLSYYFNGLI